MTGAVTISPLARKELRALAPVWAAAAAAVGAAAASGNPTAGLLAYLLGAAALGALSVGHEYANHTLAQLLSLPCDRRRIIRTKVSVLAPLLAAHGTVAWLVLGNLDLPVYDDFRTVRFAWSLNVTGLLAGLCVAPWLTMLTRSPIAGVVFTIALRRSGSAARQ